MTKLSRMMPSIAHGIFSGGSTSVSLRGCNCMQLFSTLPRLWSATKAEQNNTLQQIMRYVCLSSMISDMYAELLAFQKRASFGALVYLGVMCSTGRLCSF